MQFLYTFSHIGANNIYTVQFWYIQYHLQPCVSQNNVQSENNYLLRYWSVISNKPHRLKQHGKEDFSGSSVTRQNVPNSEHRLIPIAGSKDGCFQIG